MMKKQQHPRNSDGEQVFNTELNVDSEVKF